MSLLLVYLIRTIPRVEIEAVSEFLHNLLTGDVDVDKLPTEYGYTGSQLLEHVSQ